MEYCFNSNFKINRKVKAFTLAEIVVTLVVLGALAAILIPTIFASAPKSDRIMFKKAYYSLEKAISNMINSEVYYPSSEIDTDAYSGETVSRGFNYTNTSLSVNKFCYLLSEQFNTIGTVTCPALTGTGTFTTTDGVDWTVYIPGTEFPVTSDPASAYTTLITIDVNGAGESPDCSEDALTNPVVDACNPSGFPDTYQIGVRYDGRLNIPSTNATAIDILSNPLIGN